MLISKILAFASVNFCTDTQKCLLNSYEDLKSNNCGALFFNHSLIVYHADAPHHINHATNKRKIDTVKRYYVYTN